MQRMELFCYGKAARIDHLPPSGSDATNERSFSSTPWKQNRGSLLRRKEHYHIRKVSSRVSSIRSDRKSGSARDSCSRALLFISLTDYWPSRRAFLIVLPSFQTTATPVPSSGLCYPLSNLLPTHRLLSFDVM